MIERMIVEAGRGHLLAQMSGEITYAADDVTTIRSRLKELEEERVQARRNQDPDVADGEHLDRIGVDWGEKRLHPGETDYTFRQRLLKKIRGE